MPTSSSASRRKNSPTRNKASASRAKQNYSQLSLDDFSDDDDSVEAGNDFVQSSIRNQQELMAQQDQGLDILSAGVERLGIMSMGISEELSQQNKLLDSMETDLDTAGEELDLVTRKTQEFIRQAGGTKNCVVILILSGIVVVLIILIYLL